MNELERLQKKKNIQTHNHSSFLGILRGIFAFFIRKTRKDRLERFRQWRRNYWEKIERSFQIKFWELPEEFPKDIVQQLLEENN